MPRGGSVGEAIGEGICLGGRRERRTPADCPTADHGGNLVVDVHIAREAVGRLAERGGEVSAACHESTQLRDCRPLGLGKCRA